MVIFALALTLTGCVTSRYDTDGAGYVAAQGATTGSRADGYRVASPLQCVPYARDVSGIDIRGDAHTWWDRAANLYMRGNTPQPGAVLVLGRTKKMTSGHVAVVRGIISNRVIDVTHSNWGNDHKSRSVIYRSMWVEDISTANDWTRVRFWNREENCYGLPYAARGFIYPSRNLL